MKSKDKKFLRGVCSKNKNIKILWKQVGTDAHLKDLAIQGKKCSKKEIKIPCIVGKAALEGPLACVACSEIAWESILDWGGEGRERLIIYNLKMN